MTAMGAVAWVPCALLPASGAAPECRSGGPAYRFFDHAEARFIEAACERLIPADASGPGALAAGVPRYLDEHLSGPWGTGRRLYRDGSWQPGTPARVPLPVTPAELFRKALGAINREFGQRGISFSELPGTAQDRFLAALGSGEVQLDGVPGARFFDLLLALTVEGFFSHPLHGGTRDRVPWQMSGYPGAHARVS